MSEDNVYQDAQIVWVKLRSCWWPGEVCSHQRQPEGLLKHTKRKPYCVVKFFQEDSFEYVKNAKMIYPFNCSKKDEFIRKGHALLAKNKYMEQFPAAVSTAERLTRSVTRSSLFFNSRPDSIIKAVLTDSPPKRERIRNGRQCEIVDKILQTKPSPQKDPSQSPDYSPTYKCSLCDFQSTRQNVMVLHRRSHSGSATTPQRNAFINRSIINSSNSKGSKKSSDVFEEGSKPLETSENKIMTETLVDKEIELSHPIKNSSVVEIESDLINAVCNKNLTKELLSTESSEGVSAVFIRPPPKKQLNFINCNSENIQKSLLADWIDEDKDDEDENEEGSSDAKHIETVGISKTVIKSNQHGSTSFASTSASAEKLRNQEFVDQKMSMTLIEPEKPTSKIRNIPKKDRRNIFFTDFNETADISHMHTKSQKQNVCSQVHSEYNIDFSKPNSSIADEPILAAINADLNIKEHSKISTNIPSKMHARTQRIKSKLNYEDSCIPRLVNSAGKLHERKCIGVKSNISEAAVEVKPVNVKSSQLIESQAFLKDAPEVTHVLITSTLDKIVQNTEERNTKVTSSDNEAVVKSDNLKQSTDNLEENEAVVKPDISKQSVVDVENDSSAEIVTITDQVLDTLSRIEPVSEETPALEVAVKDFAVNVPTTVHCTTMEGETVDFIKLEHNSTEQTKEFVNKLNQLNTENSDIEPTSAKVSFGESKIQKCTIEEPTSVEYILEEQTSAKTNLIEPITEKSNIKEHYTSITIESTADQPSVNSSYEKCMRTDPNSSKLVSKEQNSISLALSETSTLELSSVEPPKIKTSTIEPTSIELHTGVSATLLEPSIIAPTTIKTSTFESCILEPPPMESSTLETSIIETATEELSSSIRTTLKSSTEEHSALESPTGESTIESTKEKPFPIKSSALESSTVAPLTGDLSAEELSKVNQTSLQVTSKNLNKMDKTEAEEITMKINKVKSTVVEPLTSNSKTDQTKVAPTLPEKTDLDSNITEINISVCKNSESEKKELHLEEPIAIKETNEQQNRLESVESLFDIFSSTKFSAKKCSLINSTTDEQSTSEIASKMESITQNDTILNEVEVITGTPISLTAAAPKLSIPEFSSGENTSSSNKLLKKKTFKKKSTNTVLELPIPEKEDETKLSEQNYNSNEQILNEKCFGMDPADSLVKSSDNTFTESKNTSVSKNEVKETKPLLRLSTPRGCKRDTFENKDFIDKKKPTKPTLKKVKLIETNLSSEEHTIDRSLETCEAQSLKTEQSSIQSIEEKPDKKANSEEGDNKLNLCQPAVDEIPIETIVKKGENTCSLSILESQTELSILKTFECVKTNESTSTSDSYIEDIDNSVKSFSATKPQTNFKSSDQFIESNSPVHLEQGDTNPVIETNESKPRSSFSKASLACFDFNEEEDILTSIANFKKTYVSPEKNYNFGLDNRPKSPDVQQLELEIKDKQLSDDIESLLKTTTLPVNIASSSTVSIINRPILNEVRGLPIKERGKRIFKSRNRFRDESCSSVSTTSTTETKVMSPPLSNISEEETSPLKLNKKSDQSQDIQKQDSAKDNFKAFEVEENVDKSEEKTMDDKITNSEEVIIGRIVFSPAEVYATSKEESFKESELMRESLVSSSGMTVYSESLFISNDNVEECSNSIISEVPNTDEEHFDNTTLCCEIEETDKPNQNFLASYITAVADENREEGFLISDRIENHNEIETFDNDSKQDDAQDDTKYNSELSTIVDEIHTIKNVDNIEDIESDSKLIDQKANLIADDAAEISEPVYDKESSVDEEAGKANDSHCDSPFEYELVTTEVSTIIDQISNEEHSLENAKESLTEVSDEVVSCCDDGTFLNEMIIADVTESQSSVAENEIVNSNATLKYVETESGTIENPTDESNSCSNNSKIFASEVRDIHVSNVKDERLKTDVEHPETSSDDSSSIISDAEAEFGSPTSMLEEDRVLNRVISNSEMSTPNYEVKGLKTTKKLTRKLQNSIKENRIIIQSMQCDTQESTSNDIVNELNNDSNKNTSDVKEFISEPQLLTVRTNSFSEKPLYEESTEKDSQEIVEVLETNKKKLSKNEKDIIDSNYENSDSSEEDEEEICSPPIEPLLDEDLEAETIENYSTKSLSKSVSGLIGVDREIPIDIVQELQLGQLDQSQSKEQTLKEDDSGIMKAVASEDIAHLNGKQIDSYYTITKKSDTIIKLNKHKDKSRNDSVDKDWIETNVDVRKSELAGEELSAAEALLLIPNQPTNMLENSTDLIKEPLDSADSLAEVENAQGLLAEEEIKKEAMECNEPICSQDLGLDTKGNIPKELVRRKRRSHMKVTPRKRIMNTSCMEENLEESLIEAKVAKMSNPQINSGSKLEKPSENLKLLRKSCAEQYEDSFVLKYMKEQLIEEMESVELAKNSIEDFEKTINVTEKQALEKVHITVDISNPLSSQIATILGTNRPSSTELPLRCGVKKRKQSVEDDIPSFIIKRPCPKTTAEEEAADRETIAQIQNLCPQVQITRKPSKDDQISTAPTSQQATTKPQIINQQILRAGNNQPLITVTAKGSKAEEGIFDISNMPIVLSNDKIVNEKVHLVITPTTNPQMIKQFQNQHQTQISSTGATASNFPGNSTTNVPKPGIPVRRTSFVRTKRTPSRQQLPEQQPNSESQSFEQEQFHQQIGGLQQPHQQQDYVHVQHQLQHQQQIQEEHNQLQRQRQNQHGQLQSQNQFQQQLQQHQFQQHHQSQIQQQFQDEQNILIQQHHNLLIQQQIQFQQHQLQNQHQLVANEKASQSNISDKQIGIDNRGNKYVIIRNPSNTVVMANSPEPGKVTHQRVTTTTESCDQSLQRKHRQKKQSPVTIQTGTTSKSPPPLPVTTPPPNILSITSTQNNQHQQYFKDHHITSPCIPVTPAVITKPKGRGRGRPPKNKTDTVSPNKQSPSNNAKVNANGRRSTGRICEPPRQRPTRSLAATTASEVHQASISSATVYPSNQQQTQSVGFIGSPQFNSTPVGSSASICTNNEPYQTQTIGINPQTRPSTAPEIAIETSEVSGGGYAVPSLPVPGYPQTYLLCELIGNKYKEVFSKPLYLSPDRTRFLEVPDELVTEAHTKLSDSRREPNPNALKLVSDGTPHILQSRLIEINSENMLNQNESNSQQNEGLMQKQHLSVEDQASALLCLQEQLTQEQLVQERLVQNQLVQEQLVQEQFVEEQFVQEQFVQEQFVQEQFVPEQFVQEQFVQEQFVQEQFVQEQFVPEQFVQEHFNLQPQQFSLQLARFETGEVIEDAERGQMMVVTTGTHNLILDDKSFFEFTGEKKIDFYNAEKDTYILTPQVISSLLHHYALGHITAVPALNTEIGDQQEVSIADVIQNADSSTNILEVALDESGLYSEEQFINTGQILQIETPEGMQLIGTAAENADLIFHQMTKANTNETNVLLNQAPKMSAVEIPSDKSKRRFETKPSTPSTLEDCLNVIGVPIQSPSVPTSLELPASVTNPTIVAKTRTPTPGTITMNEIIATGLCHHPDITSLPSMSSNDQELTYEFFQSNTDAHDDKDQVNEESVVTDMGEYAVVTSSASFDDPGR